MPIRRSVNSSRETPPKSKPAEGGEEVKAGTVTILWSICLIIGPGCYPKLTQIIES